MRKKIHNTTQAIIGTRINNANNFQIASNIFFIVFSLSLAVKRHVPVDELSEFAVQPALALRQKGRSSTAAERA